MTSSNQPSEWTNARRVTITAIDGEEYGAWELLEDIEGYASAGQVWLDDEEESRQPFGDWIIEAA